MKRVPLKNPVYYYEYYNITISHEREKCLSYLNTRHIRLSNVPLNQKKQDLELREYE